MNEEIKRFINELEEALPYPDTACEQVADEVRDHLLALKGRYWSEGMTSIEAERRALDSFGSIEDFVARFQTEGGPTIAAIPASKEFATYTGAYVGLVLGLALSSIMGFSFPLLGAIGGLALGVVSRRGIVVQRNLGAPLGAALGALAGNVAVAHYLSFHSESSFSQSDAMLFKSITIWSTVGGALVGFALGLIPRMRKDPTPLLWATALGLGAHAIARLWLEDFPTQTGLIMLAAGVLIGGCLGLHPLARRYSPVPLGAMLGLTGAFLIAFWGIRYLEILLGTSIFPVYFNPAASLPIGAFIGGLIGLWVSLRPSSQKESMDRLSLGI